ncbi:ABC transporter permease [Zavarzinia compransoris]|uniref:ABC transporter permease n=1 Tax=Zavarzinia compransoris TaxID=1264899 RepID=A0A317DT06_9PROT|nr:ABC transporter permease [Zavarzinia compransoris]PWR17817.1 ABC transporter permease [Zavarzinia compransoris]TDP49350.1 putative spermidine/putrescine transport system permease protein [Zavarzinia compransoris]
MAFSKQARGEHAATATADIDVLLAAGAAAGRPVRLAAPARRIVKPGWFSLLVPALLTLLLVFVLPLAFLAVNSLHPGGSMGRIGPAWTLDNYLRFLGDPFYLGILLDTLVVGLAVVAICAVIGYPVAYFLARTRSRWRGALTFAVLAPMLISVVVRNLGWLPILGDSGLVNWLLLSLGLVDQPVKLVYNLTGVVIGLVHALSPFMIMSLITVIRRIEPELEEAATNLGAGPFETFWRVVLPLSRPGLLAGGLLVFTLSIAAYITPAMMGGKRVLVMAVFIEQQVRSVLNYPFGATAAVVLLAVVIAATLLALRIGRERQ